MTATASTLYRPLSAPLSRRLYYSCLLLLTIVLLDEIQEAESRLFRRSHQHLQICRKEFLKPLAKREKEAGVVFTGTVERVYKSYSNQYRAIVRVKRVIKGEKHYQDNRVIVEGFGNPKICVSDIRQRDSRIFLVNPIRSGRLKLNSSLIRVNLNNLRKALAAAKNVPYQGKASVIEKPCERIYCAFGASCQIDSQSNKAFCVCPTKCKSGLFAPVCGSNNVTFNNECQLMSTSCVQQIRLYVKHTGECHLPDPCIKKECRFGAMCRPSLYGRAAECICPEKCLILGESRASRAVCGSNGVDFINSCELRRSACSQMKEITVRFYGKCDPCDGVECPSSQMCQLDDQRNPICRCDSNCGSHDLKPVCGSDGKTYANDCILRVKACRAKKSLRMVYEGECRSNKDNPCKLLACGHGMGCEINRFGIASCTCPSPCPQVLRPVCGSDGQTYDSECDLYRQACLHSKEVSLAYRGVCDGPCHGVKCDFGALCFVSQPTMEPGCECPSCSEEYNPVCGSDGRTYTNECKLKKEACERQSIVNVSQEGVCADECENKNCEFYSVCQSDGKGNGQCVCPGHCNSISSPVCGSDGVTYTSECEMKQVSCSRREAIVVASKGDCDACLSVSCKYGARCESGRCVCPVDCPEIFEPVCSSQGLTFANECHMRRASCQKNTDVTISFYGECQEAENAVIDITSTENKTCDHKTCRYGGVCDYDSDGVPHCVCSYHCPSTDPDQEPICGSDGRIYETKCKLKEEACRRQTEIVSQDHSLCEGTKTLPCEGETPLVDPKTGKDYFCGDDGVDSKLCPLNSFCHKTTHFAKCCPELTIIKICEESTYGCCPDGKTLALGPKYAGCHNQCTCNRLGSYSVHCDPQTNQCECKPGVGGHQCDRCEPGFWGLAKISEGKNFGCIPCSCNEYGSVRDDCEQMTGRCVCKHGLQGIKCDVCPEGAVLGLEGCTNVTLSKTMPGIAAEIRMRASCKDQPGHGVQCTCDIICPSDESSQKPVCASDGNIYASECQMRLSGCRMQKTLVDVNESHCKSINAPESATVGPAHRSTFFKDNLQETERPTQVLALRAPEEEHLTTKSTPTPSLPEKVISIPYFSGESYFEMTRLQAYSRLSIELEFVSFSETGVLVYNGQTASGEGDFVSLAIRSGYIEFRFNLGSGPILLKSPKPISLGQSVRVVAKRYFRDGKLSVEGQEDVTGKSEGHLKSLDLTQNMFVGHVPRKQKKVFENMGVKQGFVGCLHKLRIGRKDIDIKFPGSRDVLNISDLHDCSDNPCMSNRCMNEAACLPKRGHHGTYTCACRSGFSGKNCQVRVNQCGRKNPCQKGATCTKLPQGGFSCVCPPGKDGKLCSELQREMPLAYLPDFRGTSYLQLPTLPTVASAFVIEVWFMSRKTDGLILYNGQHSSERGDFLSLNLVQGSVEFRYNLGSGIPNVSGVVSITSKNKITLRKWHSVRMTRQRKMGTLQLDDGPVELGVAEGNLSELNLDQPLLIGGAQTISSLSTEAGVTSGLNGALQRIVVNGEVWDNLVQRAVHAKNVHEYAGSPCGPKSPCRNRGVCVPQLNDYVCKCSPKFKGKKCNKLVTREAGGRPTDKTTDRPIAFKGDTFISLPNKVSRNLRSGTRGIRGQRENEFELTFKTHSKSGLILWSNKGNTLRSDYLALSLSEGHLELSYNLGKQKEGLFVRSALRVDDGHWHTVAVHRSKRLGIIQVDSETPVSAMSKPGATQLNTDGFLWIGGNPSLPSGLPSDYYEGFVGCIGDVIVDGDILPLSRQEGVTSLNYCHHTG